MRQRPAHGHRLRLDSIANPGLALGAFLSAEALSGRDKLTLLASPDLLSFASWIEQLVAESSGKEGRGVLPIVGEPFGEPAEYGADRAFVALLLPGDDATEAQARRLEEAGRRVLRLAMPPAELGGEFFRWEFATAVLGTSLRVNPFDEPNVRDAKTRTGGAARRTAESGGNFRIESAARAPDWMSDADVAIEQAAADPARGTSRCSTICPPTWTVPMSSRACGSTIAGRPDTRPRMAWARDTCTRRASSTKAVRTPACS